MESYDEEKDDMRFLLGVRVEKWKVFNFENNGQANLFNKIYGY